MIEGKGKIANHTNNGSAYIKCAGKPTQCDSELDSVVCLCQWLAALSASTVKHAIVGLFHCCLYMWYILFMTHTELLVQVNITSKGWTPAGTNRHRASRVSRCSTGPEKQSRLMIFSLCQVKMSSARNANWGHSHICSFLRTGCMRAWSFSTPSATTSGSPAPPSSFSSIRKTCLKRRSPEVPSLSATPSTLVRQTLVYGRSYMV